MRNMNDGYADNFDKTTADWFAAALGEPLKCRRKPGLRLQEEKHTLVSAPTGTGKTLSAFLVFIDRLMKQAERGTLQGSCS